MTGFPWFCRTRDVLSGAGAGILHTPWSEELQTLFFRGLGEHEAQTIGLSQNLVTISPPSLLLSTRELETRSRNPVRDEPSAQLALQSIRWRVNFTANPQDPSIHGSVRRTVAWATSRTVDVVTEGLRSKSTTIWISPTTPTTSERQK